MVPSTDVSSTVMKVDVPETPLTPTEPETPKTKKVIKVVKKKVPGEQLSEE
jgi:hypothetical protein